MKHKEYQDS